MKEENYENNTVLFVDDEMNILKALRRGLLDQEYNKIFIDNPKKALEIMENEKVDVIVTDMRMPGMTGLELLKIVQDKYPDVVKLILSGYMQLPQVIATVNQIDIFKFITKPWNMEEEFIGTVRSAIHYFNLEKEKNRLEKELSKKNTMYEKLLALSKNKLEYSKWDVYNLNLLTKSTFENIKEDSDRYDILYEIYEKYYNTFPSITEDFSFIRLENDIDSLIKKNNISIIDKKNKYKENTYNINYKVAILILEILFKYIRYDNDVKIMITDKFEKNIIYYNVSKNKNEDVDYEYLYNLVDLLCNMMGFVLKKEIVNEELAIQININQR